MLDWPIESDDTEIIGGRTSDLNAANTLPSKN